MFAELSQVSLLGMSNSEPFVAQDGEEDGTKLEILKLPTLDFHHDCTQTTPISSSSSSSTQRRQEDKEINSTPAENEETKKEASLNEIEDDNDGFKTPTSLDHKIPEPEKCPPAPRKLKSLKRKASPSNSTTSNASLTITNIEIDFSQMVKKTRA